MPQHFTGSDDALCRDKLKHNKEMKDAEYKSHKSIREALLYMIEKAPFNQAPRNLVGRC